MKNSDFVRVTRCINCSCFIPIDKMISYGFSREFIESGRIIKADGYCDNINLWVNESDYCSQAEPKK